jgi:hypothetical protein
MGILSGATYCSGRVVRKGMEIERSVYQDQDSELDTLLDPNLAAYTAGVGHKHLDWAEVDTGCATTKGCTSVDDLLLPGEHVFKGCWESRLICKLHRSKR